MALRTFVNGIGNSVESAAVVHEMHVEGGVEKRMEGCALLRVEESDVIYVSEVARRRRVEKIGGKKFVKQTKRLCQSAMHWMCWSECGAGDSEHLLNSCMFYTRPRKTGPGRAARK